MVDSPIFLVGAERSGSTLLRLMLDSHPDITGTEGFEFLIDRVGVDGSYPSMPDYWEFLATHNIFGSSGLRIDHSLDYPALVNSFLQQRLDISGKQQVASMVHWSFDRLLGLWPDARFIHLLRDPRDVARSVVEMGWFGSPWYGVGKWIDAETAWDRLKPRLAADRWIEVSFADLIQDHETELGRVCDFVGVRYTTAMLDYANETDYAVPQPSRVSQWSRTMADRDIALVEERVGELLASRGFEPSGIAPVHLGRVDRLRLGLDNRLGMWKIRLERYGPRLFVERGLARVIPVDAFRKSVALRYNEIERGRRKRSWRAPGREYSVRADG